MRQESSSTMAGGLAWEQPIATKEPSRTSFGWSRRHATVFSALAIADLIAATAALAIGDLLLPAPEWHWSEAALALLVVLVPIHGLIGLYGSSGPCPIERLRLRSLAALGLGTAGLIVMAPWHTPLGIAAIGLVVALVAILGHYAEAAARALLIRLGVWGAPTVLLGSPGNCVRMATTLLAHPEYGFRPIGIATDVPAGAEPFPTPLPILSSVGDVHKLSGVAEVAIIATADWTKAREPGDSDGMGEVRMSRLPFDHVIVAEVSGGLPNISPRTRNLGNAVGLEVRLELFRLRNILFKRLLDLLVAVPAMIVAAPIIAFAAIAIHVADRGPAFYRQRRIGLDGRAFGVLKLRTMYSDSEERLRAHLAAHPEAQAEWNRFFKLRDDPRILPGIGSFLRRSSLDELPQIWNIIRGDMSLVGPRPFPEYHMNSFDAAFQAIRVSVPPGLTGLWQVSARSDGDLVVQKDQDLFYIRNWSIWLDLYILIQTVPAVFLARGAK